MICLKEFVEQVKEYKEHFIQYNLDGKECSKIRSMLKELQEANQREIEIDLAKKQVNQNAEVWRYLISTVKIYFY